MTRLPNAVRSALADAGATALRGLAAGFWLAGHAAGWLCTGCYWLAGRLNGGAYELRRRLGRA